MATVVPCPNCGASVEWSDRSPWRPFCSERCRLIDLGEWLNEGHRIADPTDAPSEDPPPSDDLSTPH
ncbi:DNA gyrase inhibitor YacG [Thiorhodococcus drewsii]|uniref:DNA gyrase inhibitor YacG n=1 Tax=Thiorhodococcus drewsii TaxID=210408 RepID=UPI000594AC11|nr:DNA gyrase inhibitor YacG [Thiorhodococcus drewsii]